MVLAAYEYNLLCNPFAATVSNNDDISAITRDDSKAAIYLGPRPGDKCITFSFSLPVYFGGI